MGKYIGSHVSMKAPNFYVGSVLETIENNASTLMLYTGAPQNSYRVPLEQLKINEALELASLHGLDVDKFVAHAPYLINLSNPLDSEKVEISKNLLRIELSRVEAMKIKVLVLHPGSFVKGSLDDGINTLISALNDVLDNGDYKVKIALETMAGKGSEVGRNFYEIKRIIDGVNKKHLIGVCLDTCHLNDSGFDVSNPEEILANFDEIIGLNYLLCVHLNDSKNEIGSHKDRHENIGYGTIGFETLHRWFNCSLLENIPLLLETPYIGEKSPYKKEIEMLRNNKFDDLLKV